MAKEILLYNLAEHVTDEQYLAFVTMRKALYWRVCPRSGSTNWLE
jgi:hypothetical protein